MKFIFTALTQKYKSLLHSTGIANTHGSTTKPAPLNFLYTWTTRGGQERMERNSRLKHKVTNWHRSGDLRQHRNSRLKHKVTKWHRSGDLRQHSKVTKWHRSGDLRQHRELRTCTSTGF